MLTCNNYSTLNSRPKFFDRHELFKSCIIWLTVGVTIIIAQQFTVAEDFFHNFIVGLIERVESFVILIYFSKRKSHINSKLLVLKYLNVSQDPVPFSFRNTNVLRRVLFDTKFLTHQCTDCWVVSMNVLRLIGFRTM